MSKNLMMLLLLWTMLAGGAAHAQATSGSSPSPAQARPVIKPGDRSCLRDTGSLIRAKPGQCLPVPGRSYGQDDIQRTGETQIGPALQKLDPSISVRGH